MGGHITHTRARAGPGAGRGPRAVGRGPWALGLGPWALVLGTWYLVLGTWYLVLGTWECGSRAWGGFCGSTLFFLVTGPFCLSHCYGNLY